MPLHSASSRNTNQGRSDDWLQVATGRGLHNTDSGGKRSGSLGVADNKRINAYSRRRTSRLFGTKHEVESTGQPAGADVARTQLLSHPSDRLGPASCGETCSVRDSVTPVNSRFFKYGLNGQIWKIESHWSNANRPDGDGQISIVFDFPRRPRGGGVQPFLFQPPEHGRFDVTQNDQGSDGGGVSCQVTTIHSRITEPPLLSIYTYDADRPPIHTDGTQCYPVLRGTTICVGNRTSAPFNIRNIDLEGNGGEEAPKMPCRGGDDTGSSYTCARGEKPKDSVSCSVQ